MKWIDNDTRAGPIGVSFLSNIRRSSMGLDEFFCFSVNTGHWEGLVGCIVAWNWTLGWTTRRDWLGRVAKQNRDLERLFSFLLEGLLDLAKALERRRFLEGDEPGTAFLLFIIKSAVFFAAQCSDETNTQLPITLSHLPTQKKCV